MMCSWKCWPQAKILEKFVWKLLEIPFFPVCGLSLREGWGRNFLVRVISNSSRKFKLCGLQGELPHPAPLFFLLVGHPDLPIRKTLRRVLGLLSVVLLKRVCERVFSFNATFTACKVMDEKEVPNFLMAFNLLKIIHPF